MLRTRTRQFAFTIFELLAVITIITVLVTLLLPALQSARERARIAVCLANQKHMALGFQTFSIDHRRRLPQSFQWQNAATTYYSWVYPECWFPGSACYETSYWNPNPPFSNIAMSEDGYFHEGLLYAYGYVTDPHLFFCPSQRVPGLTYDVGWDVAPDYNGYRNTSYLYRLFGQSAGAGGAPVGQLLNTKVGSVATFAISADMFVNQFEPTSGFGVYNGLYWPHTISGYFVNVGYLDGHAKSIDVGEDHYQRASRNTELFTDATCQPGNCYAPDNFAWRFFAALDFLNFSSVEQKFPLP